MKPIKLSLIAGAIILILLLSYFVANMIGNNRTKIYEQGRMDGMNDIVKEIFNYGESCRQVNVGANNKSISLIGIHCLQQGGE